MIDVDFDNFMYSLVLGDTAGDAPAKLRGGPLRLYSARFSEAELRAWLRASGWTGSDAAAVQVGRVPHPSPRARVRHVRDLDGGRP